MSTANGSNATERFRIEVTIAAPVDDVWRSLREPARIRHWHGWEYEGGGGLDGEVDLIYRQSFTENEAEHTLSLGDGGDTFTLHDVGDGRTLVRLVRGAPSGGSDWDNYYDEINEGWTTFLHQLRFALERHPGADRRTVFLSGVLGEAGEPVAALGLTDAAAVEAGGSYRTDLVGEPVSGEAWFRSANQVGVTVGEWGDGLLVVGVSPVSPTRPHGGAMVVLTTYGLSDQDLAALRDRWTRWWGEHFPAQDASADQPVG